MRHFSAPDSLGTHIFGVKLLSKKTFEELRLKRNYHSTNNKRNRLLKNVIVETQSAYNELRR